MSSDRHISEANEYIRQAEKCLKTSLLKWSPDYDGAASEYSSAATSFKNAKQMSQCKDSLLKAADCYRQNRSYFSAAKSMEQAALTAKELGNLEETANLIDRACKLFQENGTPDTAALTLEKGAKMVEGKYPAQALRMYMHASEIVMGEDRPRQAAEFMQKAARLMIRLRLFDDAVEAIRKEMELHVSTENNAAVGRLVVALVLVHLTRGDQIAAEKAYKEGSSFLENEEVMTLEELLEAIDQEDGPAANRALNSSFIKHMDVEYAKLARDMPLPQGIKQPTPSQTQNSTSDVTNEMERLDVGGQASAAERDHGDDEFSGGLC